MSVRVDAAPAMAELAAVFADRTRASMCVALLDGRAWTAGELARYAGVARSTATEHLNLLVAAGVLAEERQGRHRYLRLAGTDIAELIETLASHTPPPAERRHTLRAATTQAALARARTCYDHIAGALGVAITDAMTSKDMLSRDDGWALTSTGLAWLRQVGVDSEALRRTRRPTVRGCLDWTERRPHLAGAAGAAVCGRFFDTGWIERIGSHRAIRLTATGETVLRDQLGLDWSTFGGRHGSRD
ncbi:helix-turn-helix transcriptional regulator [Streptomyces sp. MBT62]|uniref:ArsR/SmtB family transcription factor n=1 Tax=Streptomyces sp. MBT62 TaxID=2800410 RepID=UPI00190A53E3|nr:winged helix-turn-helix domain-containing protein [Streptomyces sp. MBT62]MBK3571918.1 winged helix-turn-helix transcriptional regulator [Streptomyces sp. MBT62]